MMTFRSKLSLTLVLYAIVLTCSVNAQESLHMAEEKQIVFRESWRVNDSEVTPRFDADGCVFVNETAGTLCLPDDYREFITHHPGGITPTEEDNFIYASFDDEKFEVQLEYLMRWESVLNSYSDKYDSIYADEFASRLPENHLIIASGLIDDFVLSVDKESPHFGKVYNWTRAGDPWGQGDNTEGFGWVADSFTGLMNNLTKEQESQD